jgi:hypothetical protein
LPAPDGDLTARLNGLREVLHNEITAAQTLLSCRIDGVDAQRAVLLASLQDRNRELHAELDRRLEHFQLQLDQRFAFDRDTLTALKDMLNERYATQTKALDAAFKAAEQAVAVALANAEKATVKAETAADKRFESVNEFRAVLTDQTRTLLTRTEYEVARRALEERVSVNADRVNALELRLTSRLDLDQGEGAGVAGQRSETRLNLGMAVSIGLLVLSLATFIILYAVKK